MAIPSVKDIELPLLQELEVAGGMARPSDLYERVASHFPQLTQADREARYQKTGQLIWQNRVRFARNNLAIKGELDRSTYGIWPITDKGRARLPETTKPVAIEELHKRLEAVEDAFDKLKEFVLKLIPKED